MSFRAQKVKLPSTTDERADSTPALVCPLATLCDNPVQSRKCLGAADLLQHEGQASYPGNYVERQTHYRICYSVHLRYPDYSFLVLCIDLPERQACAVLNLALEEPARAPSSGGLSCSGLYLYPHCLPPCLHHNPNGISFSSHLCFPH